MARLYYDAQGNVLGVAQNDSEDTARFPAGIARAAGSLTWDETTPQGQQILASLSGQVAGFQWQDHKVIAGQLQRKGQAVPLPADASATTDRKAVQQNLPAIYTSLRAGNLSQAQLQRVVAFLLAQFLKG